MPIKLDGETGRDNWQAGERWCSLSLSTLSFSLSLSHHWKRKSKRRSNREEVKCGIRVRTSSRRIRVYNIQPRTNFNAALKVTFEMSNVFETGILKWTSVTQKVLCYLLCAWFKPAGYYKACGRSLSPDARNWNYGNLSFFFLYVTWTSFGFDHKGQVSSSAVILIEKYIQNQMWPRG